MIDRLVPPELLAGEGVRVYAGLVDGRAVSTGMAIALQDTVGVFNVATVPEFRGRGYGGAVTARLVADGFAAGASLACLQSSAEGYPMYERLGFETIEH